MTSPSILVADDSPTIRRVVELSLADRGYRVLAASSGREAIDRFEAERPDLVLVDVAMPEPSGYALCARIKRSPRPIPVVLLAGAFEDFDVELSAGCGADGHLRKPFESTQLLRCVDALLVRRPAPAPDPPSADRSVGPNDDEDERIADAVVRRLGERHFRELAESLFPELAERIIRERMREIEREAETEP